jgi:hypothetical protein
MSALKHVNALLGGEVSFFSDDFERFALFECISMHSFVAIGIC